MIVRLARLEDAAEIAKVHVRSWQAAYANIVPAEYLDSLNVSDFEHQWIERLSHPTSLILVMADKDIIGWASLGLVSSRISTAPGARGLYGLYLLPAYWDQGLGRKLYESIEQLVHGSATEIVLWTFEKNHRGRRFYQKMGFELDGGRRKVLQIGSMNLAAVLYRRALT